jgi:DNA-binding response OmpR family regulator
MAPLTILLLDTDPGIRTALRTTLERFRYKVLIAGNLNQVITLLQGVEPVHLVMANWVQPCLSGVEVCPAVRQHARLKIPVIIYTVAEHEGDRAKAFAAGACDLVALPINETELQFTVSTQLRARWPWAFPERSALSGIEIDRESHRVTRKGKPVDLSPKEYRALELLMRRAGDIVTREEIIASLAAEERMGVRAVDTLLSRLRTNLFPENPRLLQSVRGKGYRFGKASR